MMKLLLTYILVPLIIISSSCGSKTHYKYWDISKFNIDSTALNDNEPVKLIYSSQGPDANQDQKYYIHLIAVSQETGDTVNILTRLNNGFTMKDKDKTFNFYRQDNIVNKIGQMSMEEMENLKHVDELDNIKLKKINKIARDPSYDFIADNDYPAVIGSIGTTTNSKEY